MMRSHSQFVWPIYTCDPFGGGSFVEWPIVIDRYSSHPGGAETRSDLFKNPVLLCELHKSETFTARVLGSPHCENL